ncbi:MAG TPA: hypothetical protein VE974_29335 [Thermoanaerobaculia bacterium]|nr:hypothetical protein [Thermoanaerobaculia bacterium]
MRRPNPDAEIGLADLIEAVERLRVRDLALVRKIAEVLQVEALVRKAAPSKQETIRRERNPPPPPPPPPPPVHTPQTEYRPSTISRLQDDTAPAFAAPVPALPPPIDEASEPLPPFEALFLRSWTRAILSMSLATPGEHGPPDLHRIVERISRGQALTRIPRRVVPTLRKGVQLLVDRGSGMVPFTRDADALVREIVLVAGVETPVLHFRGLPSDGVTDLQRKVVLPYEVPPAGVPVALITDFGIGIDPFESDRPGAREWVAFLRSVRRTDSRLIAFVPYPRQRCARSIASLVTIVEWDRRTSLTRIRAALRRGWSGR